MFNQDDLIELKVLVKGISRVKKSLLLYSINRVSSDLIAKDMLGSIFFGADGFLCTVQSRKSHVHHVIGAKKDVVCTNADVRIATIDRLQASFVWDIHSKLESCLYQYENENRFVAYKKFLSFRVYYDFNATHLYIGCQIAKDASTLAFLLQIDYNALSICGTRYIVSNYRGASQDIIDAYSRGELLKI